MENLETITKEKEKNILTKIKNTFLFSSTALAILVGGCDFSGPRVRLGYTPNGSFGNPNALGNHSYNFGLGESSGILYTLRGGSLDLDHIRGAADITKIAHDRAYSTLLKKSEGFSVSPSFEHFSNNIKFEYPDNWDNLSQNKKENIAEEVSLQVGQYVGFNSTLYHELLTWFGAHFILIEPEFDSAFSWDDVYSNVIGTKLAVEAIKDENHSYDEAMTLLLKKELDELGVVSKTEAVKITRRMKGKWYDGGIIKRNLDIGEDGYITPTLIPGTNNSGPFNCPAPVLDSLDKYGIKIKYTFSSWYGADGKMRGIVNSNGPIEPYRHFSLLMRYVRKEAVEKYHHDIAQ